MDNADDSTVTILIVFSVALLVILVWFIFRDHSQRKQAELQKRRIDDLLQIHTSDVNRIQELMQEKQRLYRVVSHDVRGPFNRIFALINVIQISSGNLTNEQKEYLGKIHIMIADGLGMIRNLADSQRLEDRGIELNPELFNLSVALGVLARNYKALAGKKSIDLQVDIAPDLMICSDRYYTNHLFDNLLSNAIKFSGANNTIMIKTKEDGDWVMVEVSDNGPGISEEDQKKLYRKFQTLSAKPTGGETNTGMGLSVAKALADLTKAHLSCVSKPGEGTTFTVSIRKEVTTLSKNSTPSN